MNYLIAVLLACLFVVSGCVPQEPPAKEKTQLEIRECQTRTFDVQDHRLVMKSVLDVLQDDGYMVKNVSLDLGFLAATKDVGFKGAPSRARFEDEYLDVDFDVFTPRRVKKRSKFRKRQQNSSPVPSHEVIEVTVNVSEFGKNVRVRSTFQSKVFDDREAVMKVNQIEDAFFYQEFFAKVDKGIFLQQQNI